MNFGCSGVDLPEFIRDAAKHFRYIRHWAKETSGKEDAELTTHMVAPFEKAKEAGEIPTDVPLQSYWTTATPLGEIRNMNTVDLAGIDGTDVRDLTRASLQCPSNSLHRLQTILQIEPASRQQPDSSRVTLGWHERCPVRPA